MVTKTRMTAADITPEQIVQVATGFMAAKHLFVANQVGLFAHLAEGPTSLEEVAARTGVPRRTLRILADALAALGLVERAGDQYGNGPAAAAFLSGHGPSDLRAFLRFFDRISYPAWLGLEEAVRSGTAQTRHGHFTEEDQRIFSEGVDALQAGPAHALAAAYDFGRHQWVLDLGGGPGTYLVPPLRQQAGLTATLFELPTVVPVARERLARDGLADRVAVVAGDFFVDALPAGHDAILLANIVHLFSPARNQDLLRRIRAQVAEGARLLLVDYWTDATHTQPLAAALLAGEFLVIAGDGDVYSVDEAHAWFAACGWRPVEHLPLLGAVSLLVAEAA